jgi:alpha-glucosidase
VHQGAVAREVPLPPGRWHSWWDDRAFDGPGIARLEAPLDRIPLLVRAGSVVPTAEDGRLVLHVWPPEADGPGAGGAVFSDAGDGYGPGRVDRVSVTRGPGTLVLERTGEGDFPLPAEAFLVQVHAAAVRSVTVDGIPVPATDGRFDAPAFTRIDVAVS